jgi:hypothetical protein
MIALEYLLERQLLPAGYIKISRLYTALNKFGLRPVFSICHKLFKPLLIRNLSGSKPSLYLFDFYRLGYLCSSKKS